MHSPEALAFSIRSPFPSMRRKIKDGNPRWKMPIRHVKGLKFRYSPFMTLAGYEFYFDSWVDFWHMEPGGADSGTVCRTKWYKDKNGNDRAHSTWRWHFWHYKVSPSLLYKWRRHLFTRCAECGGPSRKGNMVNHSDGGWYGNPKTPLWCGEVHLFHADCLSKITKQRHDQIHTHVKESCYACVGKDAFKIKHENTVLPALDPLMPQEQRHILDSLRVQVDLGLMPRDHALKAYQAAKQGAAWL